MEVLVIGKSYYCWLQYYIPMAALRRKRLFLHEPCRISAHTRILYDKYNNIRSWLPNHRYTVAPARYDDNIKLYHAVVCGDGPHDYLVLAVAVYNKIST